jgi:hypothetical protein
MSAVSRPTITSSWFYFHTKPCCSRLRYSRRHVLPRCYRQAATLFSESLSYHVTFSDPVLYSDHVYGFTPYDHAVLVSPSLPSLVVYIHDIHNPCRHVLPRRYRDSQRSNLVSRSSCIHAVMYPCTSCQSSASCRHCHRSSLPSQVINVTSHHDTNNVKARRSSHLERDLLS